MVDDAVRLLPFRTGGPTLDVPRTVDDALRADLAGPTCSPARARRRELWELLATLGATDLGVARAVEPHLDARAILAQAGMPDRDGRTWGVFAAEGPGVRLDAVDDGDGWRLDGTKPWCSLAGVLDAALVTAHLAGGGRALFAVDLHDPGVRLLDQAWASRGLAEIPSTAVAFDDVAATPVGAPGWYLERPGFWWGGIGVAACWFGGAVGIGRRVHAEAAAARRPAARDAPRRGRPPAGGRPAGARRGRVGLVDAHDARRRAGPAPGQAGPGDRRGRLRGRAARAPRTPWVPLRWRSRPSTPSASPTCRSTSASSTPSATTCRWGRRSRRRAPPW